MKEASRILGVSVRTLQRWDKAGKIRCIRTVGVPESEIKRILGIREERKNSWICKSFITHSER